MSQPNARQTNLDTGSLSTLTERAKPYSRTNTLPLTEREEPNHQTNTLLLTEREEEKVGDPSALALSNSVTQEQLPFQEFQAILAFLNSIGLATTTSGAYTLATASSVFGDTSHTVLAAAKHSATLLCFASACFIVALTFVVATQLMYKDPGITRFLKQTGKESKKKRDPQYLIVEWSVSAFALIGLLFQIAAFIFLSESLYSFSRGATYAARYGIIGGTVVVGLAAVAGRGGLGDFTWESSMQTWSINNIYSI